MQVLVNAAFLLSLYELKMPSSTQLYRSLLNPNLEGTAVFIANSCSEECFCMEGVQAKRESEEKMIATSKLCAVAV